ncbi:MAG: hypothetical protein IKB71_11600 [Lentisphaeria bacterium]|nr:hypothetical protein [Lentisphaeria bacterium]
MFNIIDYGAVGDGITKDTAAIQRAIDECAVQGGTVIVPPGVYLTGSIYLKSNVELHIQKGATLLGSPDLNDYNEDDAYPQNYSCKPEGWSAKHLILAIEVENVALTGLGTIDGNARSFFDTKEVYRGKIGWRDGLINAKDYDNCGRPGQEIVFIESRNIKIKDLHFFDMCCWNCFLHGCENAQITGLRIENNISYANTDGLDIDCCRNVTVSNCIIRTGDDAIAIRGYCSRLKDQSKICENITITNCVFYVSADGMRIGVGSGTIRNVVVSNIVIEHAGCGLHLQNCYGPVSTGVNISDVSFSNIIIRNTPIPIIATAGTKNSIAYLKNISFSNINVATAGHIIVNGLGKTVVSNVSFSDVYVECLPYNEDYKYDHEGSETNCTNAIFKCNTANNIRFNNVVVANNTLPPLATNNVENLSGEIKTV